MAYMRFTPARKTDTLSVHNGTKKIAEVRLQAGPLTIAPRRGHALTARERQDIAAFAEHAA
jgi:hypothetical protein